MKNSFLAIAAALGLVAIGFALGRATAPKSDVRTITTVTSDASASTETASAVGADDAVEPESYPAVVDVGTIPDDIAYEFEDEDQAVAIAPGVWAKLVPGASLAQIAKDGVLYGYCPSIEAWAADHRPDGSWAGSCT